MAIKTFAPGNAPNTGASGFTPAPKKPVPPINDLVSAPRGGHEGGYGQNDGANNPSSIPPGTQKLSPLAANLKASSEDGEGVLDHVIANGAKMSGNDQTRAVSKEPLTPTYGMAVRSDRSK